MPKLAEKYDRRQYYADVYNPKISEVRTLRDYQKTQYERSVRSSHLQVNKKKVKRNNILHKIISVLFFSLIAVCFQIFR